MDIEQMIIDEANQYFERNKNAITNADEVAYNAKLLSDFLREYKLCYPDQIKAVLEIGCNYGYNLNYFSKDLSVDCYGIEPSDKAVLYGKSRWNDNGMVHLEQGISNSLPYETHAFDVVTIGFLLYVTPRAILADSIKEANRVLRPGGFLVITDFDTPVNFIRTNKHNPQMPVYKENYAERFLNMGYSLIEKHSYSHGGTIFNPIVQERVSTQIMYKEYDENIYTVAE